MCQVLFRMLEKKMSMKRMKPLSWISNSTERDRKQTINNFLKITKQTGKYYKDVRMANVLGSEKS